MSLSRKIAAAVEALPRGFDRALRVEDGPRRLALELSDVAPVGVAFERLTFETDLPAPLSPAALETWGRHVAGRLTYLMEPLVVLEIDAALGELELRSAAPTRRDDHRRYYEARLENRGVLTLRRIGFDENARRRSVVPCQMTLETLTRLADDLAAAAPDVS